MSHQCSRMGTRCSRDHCPLQNGTSWPGSSSDFATQKHANGHGWAVWKEVNQIREFYNAGLSGNRENQDSCDQHSYQSNQHQQNTPHNNSNSTHVPMDVDNTTATIPFQKLTDNKCAQYCAKGRCFRCRLKGYLARDCPKNSNPWSNTTQHPGSNAWETTTDTTTSTTAPTPPPPPLKPTLKLTKAQQICAIEELMNDEEQGEYFNACNMGEDCCDSRLWWSKNHQHK